MLLRPHIYIVTMLSTGLTFDELKAALKMECERHRPRPSLLKHIRSLSRALDSWVCLKIKESREQVSYHTVKITTRLGSLFGRFRESRKRAYHFVVYGGSVADDDTPQLLSMNDNHTIYALQYQ